MNLKYSLTAMILVSLTTLTGCFEEDDNQESQSSSDKSSTFSQGWGITPGTSYDTIQSRINAVPAVAIKTIDGGTYVTRSNTQSTNCGPEHIGSQSIAYWSTHFEIGVSNQSIPVSDVQRLAAMAEVSLEMIAHELNVSTHSLIKHTHTDSQGNKRLGLCVISGSSSIGSGHGSELVLSQSNNYGGVYEFTLVKHELGHMIDSQFNNNEFAYNLYPGWWAEGLAEMIAGTVPLSATEWSSLHSQYVQEGNIVTTGDATSGGYDAYPLYYTMVHYLRERGWGPENFMSFVKSDRWHADGTTDFDPENYCASTVPSNYGATTGSCMPPQNIQSSYTQRFDAISLSSGGEVQSLQHFESNYYQLISDWLVSR